MIEFKDKTVVVVGGTSGINRGIALSFAAAGARVAVASRSEEKVADTVNELKQTANDAMGFCCDVRKQEQVAAGLKEVADVWGGSLMFWFRGRPETFRHWLMACLQMAFAPSLRSICWGHFMLCNRLTLICGNPVPA